jgi:hypothetical protein
VALEEYIRLYHTNGNPLMTFEMDDFHHLLGGHDEILDRMFPLMGGEILVNGHVFDPVVHREQDASLEEHRLAVAAELGIEM